MVSFGEWINDNILGTSSIGDALVDPNNPVGQALSLGIASYMTDKTRAQKPKVGYQGKIEDLTKVKKRVQQPVDGTEGRRTGILSAVTPTLATMEDMNFAEGMEDAEKQRLLDAENAKRRAEANAASIRQGDMYAQGEERRPGGRGRRYFTDTIYAKTPENKEIPTLEEAEKQAQRQKLRMEGKTELEIDELMDTTPEMAMGGRVPRYAHGGIAGAHKGYYLGGKTDGMADQVPARIDGKQEARLSDGEFVIPADVVSHLGNGNSDAGAQQLHSMMDNVRTARTGNPNQGKQINPQNFMPKMAQGGLAQFAGGGKIKYFNEGGDTGSGDDYSDPEVGLEAGTESSLSTWAGDYVTDMLAMGQAEAKTPYEAYEGPLTAGASELQGQAFTGMGQLNNPMSPDSITNQMGAFTPDAATLDPFMNPYTQNVIDRTAADMRRQSQIDALQDRSAMTAAGAFGGSRDALMRAERASNLSRNIGDMSAEQRAAGFNQAIDRAQQRQQNINQYGLDVLAGQAKAGAEQRGIASEGIAADYGQFREERDYDKKAVQYMQSLLQGLPLAAQSYSYTEPSSLDQLLESEKMLEGLAALFGYTPPELPPAETTTTETT